MSAPAGQVEFSWRRETILRRMKPIDQTKFRVPEGNCFSACVASLLHLPIEDVPTFCAEGDKWFEVFQQWLRPLGLYAFMLKHCEEWRPDGYYILGGKSPRGDFFHAVIARDGEIVHDPHPSRTGLVDRQDYTLIVPFDLSEFDRRPLERLYIFDADATLRRCTVKDQACPNRPGEWEVIPWAKERLAAIDWTRNGFGIVSNQGGIALGYLSEWTARKMLVDLAVEMTGRYPHKNAIRLCPHAPNAGCACRKPSGEMIRAIVEAHGFEPKNAVYVGDLDTDRLAAESANVPFVWAWDFCGRTCEEWTTYLAERASA